MDNVRLLDRAYNPWALLEAFQQARFADATDFGATAVFTGTMRDFNEGDDVAKMYLEHYPGMTLRYLQTLADTAKQRWSLNDCLIVHRYGDINPGETIVLTAAWSAHRGAAFDACRYLIEDLKHHAPFWKKETLANGDTRWVAENTPG